MAIRQPIVTVAGHVDHGKTTILDSIRGSVVQAGEAGGITQRISFTAFPKDEIRERCPKVLVEIPGFLFIDTPGHAAFSNLRKRGGALADMAVLVIDINEGIKPQTAEVIEILKLNKTPFVIALNKVDNISGWSKQNEDMRKNIEAQSTNAKQDFEEKMLILVGALHSHGFEAAPYYDITDFTSKVALIPCSGKTGEGISELISMLCGLSQKFLKGRLSLGKEAKGVVIEIKKQKALRYVEAILYDGVLAAKEEIVIASFDEPITGKIRILEEILPLSTKFKPVHKAHAAIGIRMQLTEAVDILPGMPFQVLKDNKEEIRAEFKKEVGEKTKTDDEGIIVKADSLGSLEALMILLREEGVKIVKAGIGNIDKKDVISATTNLKSDPTQAVILGFNVVHEEDIHELPLEGIKILENDVVYRLIEDLKEYQDRKRKEIEKEKLLGLSAVCKLHILPDHVFRNSNPAIFGVRIEAGKLRAGTKIMNENGEEVAKVKNIQAEKKKVEEAGKGEEVAISLPGVNFERQLADKEFLYSALSAGQFKEFKKNKELLTVDEISALQRIAQIKRAKEVSWGV